MRYVNKIKLDLGGDMKYYVGIDLGGTNTKIGLVDKQGNIIFTTIVKTDSMEGFSETIQRLSKILITQLKEVILILMMLFQSVLECQDLC